MKSISFLDTTSAHLPNLMEKADRSNLNHDKIIVTDNCVTANLHNKFKIAWLVEPECVVPHSYAYIRNNYLKFDNVITHNKQLLDTIPNAEFMPFGTTFLADNEISIFSKTKNFSMISSGKNFTKGHAFRLSVMSSLPGTVDLYGRDVRPIDSKLQGLRDYRYSIAIENEKQDYWFTEKLIDCFLTGTIPIYWGCPSISNFFNTEGMIIVESVKDILGALDSLDERYYSSKLEAIYENFETAKTFMFPYDNVYNWVNENESCK